jgi:hypothetical protein
VTVSAAGFWSYVRADDGAERGRIVDLAHDVVAQYELLTGESIELFLDRDNLQWGEAWREKIEKTLAAVAFFIPVLTPRYFQRKECRAELQQFAQKAEKLGVSELVMPILYVDVPGMHDPSPADDLMRLVRGFEWEDWTEHRLSDVDSAEYRTGVARLAARLVGANRKAESGSTPITEELQGEQEAEEQPGWLDQIAGGERDLPLWSQTMTEITAEVESLGKVMEAATAEVEAAGASATGRIAVARNVAAKMLQPSQRILELGSRFALQLHSVDTTFRLLIERGGLEAAASSDQSVRNQTCAFFMQVRALAEKGVAGLGQMRGMVDTLAPLEAASREFRPVVRTLTTGLTTMAEGADVMRGWLSLIEASPLNCG